MPSALFPNPPACHIAHALYQNASINEQAAGSPSLSGIRWLVATVVEGERRMRCLGATMIERALGITTLVMTRTDFVLAVHVPGPREEMRASRISPVPPPTAVLHSAVW